ncbi:hypothetical protein DUZ99_16835 [Xylanibacillus composti]|uniref:Thiamin pyrophosphokinase n=1 Tax=Xylanibacillus composti TaxID=1572762 RepID=A0A8J4M2T6_9BACL|nr:putative cytokinetic ring protein SteA [Xylanibacillus composti]MDT9726644.1 hypothetical protein [Xylanibacillus composti]GIQ69425.1 thiamin pyrophosphokinase [Xylanibacillus composti]
MRWRYRWQLEKPVSGVVRVNKSTKRLIPQLQTKEIAVLCHEDLDEMAAEGLIAAKVRAVVNASCTMSGTFMAKGAEMLLRAGIPIVEVRQQHFSLFRSGMRITIEQNRIVRDEGGDPIPCRPFDWQTWQDSRKRALQNEQLCLKQFIENTLSYASKEKQQILQRLPLPDLQTSLQGRHALVVVRGSGFREDLQALREYIADFRPVLIGVDGGADALITCGYRPDMIIGDMDSITNEALLCGAEIIVHAYPNGHAPGMQRVKRLGIWARSVPASGTSEDLAMRLAYEKGAALIVTLGTHTHMIDFLEKGRKGMASTLLVRMKIGDKLVDAKGVSKLYRKRPRLRHLWLIPTASLFPFTMLAVIHPQFRELLSAAWLLMKGTLA